MASVEDLHTAKELREVARAWDQSADFCDERGLAGLAARDRKFAALMRKASLIIEAS